MEFFTAEHIDKSMQKRIEKYIDKFKNKGFDELIEKDWRSNRLICPFCRHGFDDYTFFLRHYRFYKHRWELKLLERIYKYGPRQLEVFDAFYEKDGYDDKLYAKVRLWVLSLKIFEMLDIMPFWKTTSEFKTKDYLKRLFWEKNREASEDENKL